MLFGPRADLFLRLAGLGVLSAGGLALWTTYGMTFSSYGTAVGEFVAQPVPFSHARHVGGLGMDCRYCHATAEHSARAGMPTTETCMHCHAQLWTDAELLAPVRSSWRSGVPIPWQRVHDLPDFAFFDHSVHLAAGVGCTTCHGRVDRMPLMTQVETLHMRWCLDCHRDPEPNLRPTHRVYELDWDPDADRDPNADLLERNAVRTGTLTDCTACHR